MRGGSEHPRLCPRDAATRGRGAGVRWRRAALRRTLCPRPHTLAQGMPLQRARAAEQMRGTVGESQSAYTRPQPAQQPRGRRGIATGVTKARM